MIARIQVRRDTTVNWELHNPPLRLGEIGLDITNNKFKVGGESDSEGNFPRWNDLNYELGQWQGHTRTVQIEGSDVDIHDIKYGFQDDEGDVYINNDLFVNNDVKIEGNLTVRGDTTTVNTVNSTFKDNIIELNLDIDDTGDYNENLESGIQVNRGILDGDTESSFQRIYWQENDLKWVIGADLNVLGDLYSNGTKLWAINSFSDIWFNGTVGIGDFDQTDALDSLHILNTVEDSNPGVRIQNDEQTWAIYTRGSDSDKLKFVDISSTELGTTPFQIETNAPNNSLYIQGGTESTGYVGIGTDDPYSPLEVATSNDTSEGGITLRSSSTGGRTLRLWATGSKAHIHSGDGKQPLYLNSSGGNVSIGSDSSSARLSVTRDNNSIELDFISPWNRILSFDRSEDDGGEIPLKIRGLKFTVDTDDEERFRIETDGKVGIGTTSPDSLFEVEKNNNIAYDATKDDGQRDGTATIQISNQNGSVNSFSQLLFDTAGTGQSIARIAAVRVGNGSNDLAFALEHGDTKHEAMRIKSTGNVGIGTASPEAKLTVDKTGQIGFVIQEEDSNEDIYRVHMMSSNSNDGYYIGYAANGVEGYKLNSNGDSYLMGGKVGIGTSGPGERLTVKAPSTSSTAFKVEQSGDTQTAFSVSVDSSDNGQMGVFDASENTKVFIRSSGDSYFNGGRVGIGTQSPSGKFNVAGGETHLDHSSSPPARGSAIRLASNNDITLFASNQYWGTDGSDGITTTRRSRGGGTSAIYMDHRSSASAGDISFATAPNGNQYTAATMTTRMIVKQAGDVQIPTGNLIISASGKGINSPNWTYNGTSNWSNTSGKTRTLRFGEFSNNTAGYFGPSTATDSNSKIDLGTSDGKFRNAHFSGTVNADALTEGGTALSSKYLELSGGTLTGDLSISKSSPKLIINSHSTTATGDDWPEEGAMIVLGESANVTPTGDGTAALYLTYNGNGNSYIGTGGVSSTTGIPKQGFIHFTYNKDRINLIADKVGIGTSSPENQLDVAGNAVITGTLNVTGTSYFENGLHFHGNETSQTEKHATGDIGDILLKDTTVWSYPYNTTKSGAKTIQFTAPNVAVDGTRYYLKFLHYDAESGSTGGMRWTINDADETPLHYNDVPGNQNDESYTWSTFDITDHVVTGTNTLYFWSSTGDGGSQQQTHVFTAVGLALPNEPVELQQHFYKGLTTDGNVGIGKTSPTEKLDVNGNITATGNITSASDITLKENIELITDPIKKVKGLGGYTFNKKGEDLRMVGLIAQEVQKVLPEAVHENQEGIKSLAYGNMVALLVECIKKQDERIETLEKTIEKLKL